MKLTNNIALQEVVSKDVFTRFGTSAIWFIEPRIIHAGQKMIDHFGPAILNNWASGGIFEDRGYRSPIDPTPTGSKEGQHIFGRALDLDFTKVTPQEVYDWLLKNEKKAIEWGITTVEDISFTPTWNHIDCRPTVWGSTPEKLFVVKPKK